jgi:hypothetical protein
VNNGVIPMDFMSYVKEGIEILKLDKKVMEKVAKDEKATTMAILFFAIGGVASAIGGLNLFGIIIFPIVAAVFSFIGVGIIHILAKLFGGKAEFMQFYRSSGIGYVGSWVAVIPIIGPMISGLVGLWYLVVSVVMLMAVHKLSTGKAIIVVLIPVVLCILLVFILAATFLAAIFGMGGMQGLNNLNYMNP